MLIRPAVTLLAPLCLLAADLAGPNPSGISYGHFHFNTRDLAEARKFWTLLGAAPSRNLAANEVYAVKNALVLVRQQEPLGGTEATLVHHVGFAIKDFDGTLDRIRQAGYKILTAPEAIAKNHKANVLGPDQINIELVGDPNLSAPIASHHVHWYNAPLEDTRAWYVKTFSAIAGKRDQFQAADLPGINLSFSAPRGPVKPTKGYALDHIGFEVKNLEAFCKQLEAAGVKFDRPFTKMPQLGISLAFLTDPWGTNIELTEGLDTLK